jgi:hypothetical protein
MKHRRRHPRYEIDPGLPGTLPDGTRITLIELSAGGCRVHAQTEIAPVAGENLQFEVGRERGSIRLTASAVHATPVSWIFRPSTVIGFQLEPESSRQLARALALAPLLDYHV